MISKAADQHGRVDGVASCVGSMLIKPAHLTGTDEFVEQMRENALSAFHILKGSVRLMPTAYCFSGCSQLSLTISAHPMKTAPAGTPPRLTDLLQAHVLRGLVSRCM